MTYTGRHRGRRRFLRRRHVPRHARKIETLSVEQILMLTQQQ